MPRLIHVNREDHRPCNLRCARSSPFCARYPACVAGAVHRVAGAVSRDFSDRIIVHEELRRSPLGGRSRTRIVRHLMEGTEVEEVELYCTTLDVDSTNGELRSPHD